jgi:Ig-like domain-containing protein/centrosomal CEP192-like protein
MNRLGLVLLVSALAIVNTGCVGGTSPSAKSAPGAPSITAQPINQTATTGKTATFAVAATGTAPLSYQWRKNGMPISGASSSTYTTPTTTTSDSGVQFNVTVSNSAGSVISNAVTLTVNAPSGPLSISTSTLSFGNVSVGSGSVLGVTFTNSGSVNINISNVIIAGPGFTASGLPAGLVLTSRQAASLSATFAPAAAGSVTGSVSVTSDASNSPATITLSGTGVQPVAHSAGLSWIASPSTVIGYNVYRATISGGPYTLLNSSLVPTTQYSDANVQSGQTYYYVVTAVDSSKMESSYSNQSSATIPTP